MLNLVILPSGKTQTGVFRFPDFWSIPYKKKLSRTSDNTDMKLGLVTKRNKKNKATSKKFDNDVMSENCDVIVIFTVNLEHSGSQILDA